MRFVHPKKIVRVIYEQIKHFMLYYLLPDKWYLSWKFRKMFGRPINWKNPCSFNEKINWLKLHDRNPQYHLLIDKLRVKSIVAKLIGDEYIIPTIGSGIRTLSELNKESLPDRFVLKCNHDAASVVICHDKAIFDWEAAGQKLHACMSHDYYHFENKQWAYKGIDRYIFVEQYMEDGETHDLPDYKFYCFNGNVKCIFVGRERFKNSRGVLVNMYDRDWNKLPFEHFHPNYEGDIPRPKNLNKMIEIAEQLARYVGNPFMRIDLYDINNKIYFGEFTFYPGGGFEEFRPEEWDYTLGTWMRFCCFHSHITMKTYMIGMAVYHMEKFIT